MQIFPCASVLLHFLKFKICLIFQCNDCIPEGNETLHINGHYVNCKVDQMRKYLTDWMEVYRYFVEHVGGDLIHRKGLTVEDYMYNVVQPGVLLNEIGILLYARMYKIHIAIILEGKYWTTNKDKALNCATIYLIY